MFPPKIGGSSRWFWEIYRRLPRKEFVIAAGNDPKERFFDASHDLRIVRLPLQFSDWGIFGARSFRWYWSILKQLERTVKAEKIGRVHCGRCLPEGWIGWMLKQRYGMPYVCYVHGEEANTATLGEPTGVLSSRQLRWMMQRVVRGAEFLIANSQNTRSILMRGWGLPAKRIRVLHPGVDTAQFVPAEEDESVRSQLGWNNREVVLTVGRLEVRKGHDQIINALHGIREAIPNVLYAIVGEGERRKLLEDLVQRNKLGQHVQFLGEVNDKQLLQCYQQCDLFVLPNRQVGNDIEGFGMVLLEAQACGKPVVAGASGGTAETMRVPETGLLISCDNLNELQAVVHQLLKDRVLRRCMGKAARQWVVEHFDWAELSQKARLLFHCPM
jgi:phosphatidylinositol alpha-1,6-mannosyltransferase